MKISRKDAVDIQKNGASIVTYSDQEEKYGFIMYSLKDGQPYNMVFSTTAKYNNEQKAKGIGKSLVEKITGKRPGFIYDLGNVAKCLI